MLCIDEDAGIEGGAKLCVTLGAPTRTVFVLPATTLAARARDTLSPLMLMALGTGEEILSLNSHTPLAFALIRI